MTPLQANAVALLAAFAWGIGNVSQKTVLDHIDPFLATGLSCLLGAVVLTPFARREARINAKRPKPSLGLAFAVAASFAVAATLMQIGYGHTTVTNAGFLANTSAVITPLLAWAIQRQRPPLLIFPASLLTGVGVFYLAGGSWSGVSSGDLLCLAAAAAFALWTILLGEHVGRHRNPHGTTLQQLCLCAVACMVFSVLLYGLPTGASLALALPDLLMMGVVSKGAAYTLNAMAQQHIHPTCASVLMSAEAVFGALCAMIFLGESLNLIRGGGAALIIAAIIITSCVPQPVQAVRQDI